MNSIYAGLDFMPLDLLKPPAELRVDAAGLESMAFVNWQGDACVFPE